MTRIFLPIFLIIICLYTQSFGENKQKMDSLKLELQNAKSDTVKLKLYKELWIECDIPNNLLYAEPALKVVEKILSNSSNINRKLILKYKAEAFKILSLFYQNKKDNRKTIEYLGKQLSIYQEINDTSNIVSSVFDYVNYYLGLGNSPKALEFCKSGLRTAQNMNDKNGIGKFFFKIGEIYRENGDYNQALENYKKSLNVFYELKDTIRIANRLKSIGDCYSNLHEIKNGIDCYKKAISFFELLKDKRSVIWVNNVIGLMYMENNDWDKSLTYFKKSLLLSEAMNDKFWVGVVSNNMGNVYNAKGDLVKALESQYKALRLSEEINDSGRISWSYSCLARTYMNQKNYKKAKIFSDFSIGIVNRHQLEGEGNSHQEQELLASQIDSVNGDYTGAYKHYKHYVFLRDKQKSEDVMKSATKEKYQNEFDKQKAIDKVKSDKEIEQQRIVRNSFVVGFSLMMVLAGISYRNFRRKKKDNQIITRQKKEVENQKQLVEEKNREILDSIEYALRIQTAILPTQKIVKQYLENSFILYKPKDIVAGDFYWMESIGDVVLFAACDCTGHGVPGAMVSVVCHNSLNRAVREFGLTQPAAILDKTTEIVLENFSKSDEEIHDGMDISICALNTKTNTLEWAGANNSLLLINNGQLTETKADKQCIGYNDNVKNFTNHIYNLYPDTSIYLFTDGFADQFGGQPERKITKNRFKELLLSIQHMPIQQQATELDNFITNYKKNIEQTDDILVIGVRV
jgi:serine phosphatase RsbU (regulator of sigma subunit)